MSRIHQSVRRVFGLRPGENERQWLRAWRKRTSEVCKPCWELQYCPYGPLVEDFPLLPQLRPEAKQHNAYLKGCLATGRFGDGKLLEPWRRRMFERDVAGFRAANYPESIPPVLLEAACKVFGHICPAFLVSEPLTETRKRRTHGRSISREVMLKVVRRDGQICQKCHRPVPDNEVEFDHIIPFSKGGRSTADNLRLMHRDCNRRKGDSLDEILHPRPIDHLIVLQRKRGRRGRPTRR